MDWSELPKELLTTIFSFLGCSEVTSVVCVNSIWNAFTTYTHIWKKAILNDGIPHNYSSSQKNVPWRQFATKYLETKRNIVNKRCVQYTLGTRCQAYKPNASIVLGSSTVNSKYCILPWDMIEQQGYSWHDTTHINTEIWDLEARTIISNSTRQQLELCNNYILQTASNNLFDYQNDLCEVSYGKFDPYEPDRAPDGLLELCNVRDGYVTTIGNDDPNSSLVILCCTDWGAHRKTIHVFDLRSGNKILTKDLDDTNNLVFKNFQGSKLLMRYHSYRGYLLVLDVLKDEQITIEVESLSAVIAGDSIWAATMTEIVKYDMTTKTTTKYTISSQYMANVNGMKVMDGIIWLMSSYPKLTLIDVSSSTCRVLAQIMVPGFNTPGVSLSSNGAYVCLSTSYANILSFKNEETEVPIQVLQIETNGDSQIIDMKQGDLNETIAKYYPRSVTSQIVFEDKSQRYCIIYSYVTPTQKLAVNQFVETAKKWLSNVEYHKTAIFQLVHFDNNLTRPQRVVLPDKTSLTPYGTAWVIYETKINDAWQRGAPVDYWKFFKTKLGLK